MISNFKFVIFGIKEFYVLKIIRITTPEENDREKDEAFQRLTPAQRLAMMRELREKWRDPNIDYTLEGSVVRRKSKDDL